MTNPNLYRVFRAGKFAVQSTCTGFSKMAFNRALKQNNKTTKATNGYINVVNQENKTKMFLRILEVGTPECMINPTRAKKPNSLTCY